MAPRRRPEDEPARLELAVPEPDALTEQELVQMFRESIANDRTILYSLLMIWPTLSPAHRGLVYRVADALWSACRWQLKPGTPDPTDAAARRAEADR